MKTNGLAKAVTFHASIRGEDPARQMGGRENSYHDVTRGFHAVHSSYVEIHRPVIGLSKSLLAQGTG